MEKTQIVIKEDWKGEAIKVIMAKVGYGITIEKAKEIIPLITDSICKVEIKNL